MGSSMSSVNDDHHPNHTNTVRNESKVERSCEDDPLRILKNLKLKNYNPLIVGQININGIRNNFESLLMLIKGNIEIFEMTEINIDESFPSSLRLDRDVNGGGVIIFDRQDIPCKEIKTHFIEKGLEGIFLEINLRKS